MIGYHLFAATIYIYRATGGSWRGGVGSHEEFWDGIFLNAGLHDLSNDDAFSSLHKYYHPINKGEGLGKGNCILIIQGTSSSNKVGSECGMFNSDCMHTEETADKWTTLSSQH